MCHGFAQVIANFAFELCRTFDNGLQRTVFIQPFHCCFGTHFRHTRDVIHGVANQREVIADACGRHAKLFHHTSGVGIMPRHGIDQMHALVDQLRHVFVARGNDHFSGIFACQCADHIIRFHTLDDQQRITLGANNG